MARPGRPHELVATVAPEHLVAALVRNLAELLDAEAAYYAVAGPEPRLDVVASWPERPSASRGERLAGAVAEQPVAGGGVVRVAGRRPLDGAQHSLLRQTAGWLGLAVRLATLREDRDRAETRIRALREDLAVAKERLHRVRDLERRRLVQAITATTLRDLTELRRRLRRLDELLLAGPGGGVPRAELAAVHEKLDEVVAAFRVVARGVYPAMLPERGPRAALEELAATLPRPVRFAGDLGRRVAWPVESGLYHAVAAVLNLLAGKRTGQEDEMSGAASPVTVDFRRDDALRVRVSAPTACLPAEELGEALATDADRLAVLGGTLDCAVAGDRAVIEIRIEDRIGPAEVRTDPPRFEHSAIYQQARDLVRRGQKASEGMPDRSRWDAVAARLTQPPRLAVVVDPADPAGAPDLAGASVLGVTVIVADGPAGQELAAEFVAGDGPRGSVDAVLCLVPSPPSFRAELRWARQRVMLSESADPAELARELVAWGPVIAARRAVVAARELVARLPADHQLRWSIDRIAVEGHEIAELDLLDDIERGDPRLLRPVVADATRLLGAHGTDPRTRLGLADDAGDGEVRAAAELAVRSWRAWAEHPGTGGRDRAACEVLVRTAEGLLSVGRTR